MYRDMPTAAVWITTPGGLTSGSLPPQLENRPLKLGELVYEQSDLVIFDEADTIIKWLDDHYAQELKLTGGRQGLLDTITLPTERHTIGARVMPPGTQRWVGAERAAQQVVSAVLTMLDPGRGPGFLQQWVANHQFTPLTLGYRLARAVAGLEDYDRPEVAEELRQANDELTRAVLAPFEALFDEPDPLRPLRATNPSAATQALWQLVQRINNTDESATDAELRAECSQWLRNFGLSQVPDGAERPVAAVERLAYQLQFVLTVALLDRHSRIVFYEWDQRPAGVQVDAPNYRSRAAMQSLLPLPLTGRQFGTYYARAGSASGSAGHALSLFAYTNVGRHYVLHYHELFADLTGERGPNVLAMSGTSYLPASTTFHVSRPQALLLPPPEATAAIAQSKFAFLPQRDATDKGIRISGGGRQVETPGRITELIKGLVGRDGQGRLAGMLNTLARAEEREPALWADRGRLLLFVNSYEQAHRAAEALRRYWPACRDGIRHLLPRLPATGAPEGGLLRADIEQFAHAHDGCVLVAPLNAVGRGFNILNTRGKAAFGAVYFLTRPYPHPNDAQAVARELNRRTFDWAADENLAAWQTDGLLGKADAARRLSLRYWGRAESRAYYSTLADDPDLGAYPRRDLAATTIGYVIQAVGRLLRGGVPFHAFFVDAAWGPRNADRPDSTARLDSPKTSLLAAMLELLAEYTAEDEDENDDPVGRALYAPLQAALDNIEGFNWEPDAPKKYRKA
jgi:hypothetical protein